MDILLHELRTGLPDWEHMIRVATRLTVAALLGAVVGIQRERVGKSAGIRTHMLICMGTAFIVFVPQEAGFSDSDLASVIHGVAAGIGFLGAGAILKLDKEREISGLTTAAGIWTTAAVGVAVGLGRLGSAALGVLLAWMILSLVWQLERRFASKRGGEAGSGRDAA